MWAAHLVASARGVDGRTRQQNGRTGRQRALGGHICDGLVVLSRFCGWLAVRIRTGHAGGQQLRQDMIITQLGGPAFL